MALKDVFEHSSKIFRNFSMNKKDQNRKLKRLNKSIVHLSPQQRQTKHVENFKEQIQQPKLSLHAPSIRTTSELSRSISNRSVTFASIFDEQDNENNNQILSDRDTSLDNEDLIIVVPNKYVLNEPIVHNSDAEPYPFRSQIPLCLLPKSSSSTNIARPSHSKTKSLHFLVRSRRPKKLRHPVKSIQSVNSMARSKSTPILSSTPSSMTNDHHRSLKTIGQWFSSSSLGRFIQSFLKHPTANTTISNKPISSIKPISSDLIY